MPAALLLQRIVMTVKRNYYCDLCGTNGDIEPLRGIHWQSQATRERAIERPFRTVEHHICNKCLEDLKGFPAQNKGNDSG